MSGNRSSPADRPMLGGEKCSAGAGLAGPLPLARTLPTVQSQRLASALPSLRHGFTFALPRLDDAGMARELGERLGLGGGPWLFDQPHGVEILDVGAPSARGTVEPAKPKPGVQEWLSRDAAAAPRDALAPTRVPMQGYDGGMARLAAAGRPRQAGRALARGPNTAQPRGADRSMRGTHGPSDGALCGPTLAIKAADCVPVLAVHPEARAYAALHAGWRGVAAGILPRLLSAWRRQGLPLSGVVIALGPHIRCCCFEVRGDCLARFPQSDLGGAVETRDGSTYLSLERVLTAQAGAFGIPPLRIEALPFCTCCYRADGIHPFASYRRAGRERGPAGDAEPEVLSNLAYIGPAS